MKALVRLFGLLAIVGFTSSAFAGKGEVEIEKYVRTQIAQADSDLKKDLLAKMADYDTRHIPDTTTAKASEYKITARKIGDGHYRHTEVVARYLVSISFEIVRVGEVFPAEFILEVDKMTMEDGKTEFQVSEGHIY